jgi:YcaO-like protein with predicted kinase domain
VTPSDGPSWAAWQHRSLCPPGLDSDLIAFQQGTHRVLDPQQTWAAIQPHFATAGITRIADLTGLDDIGIPTAQAIRPASMTLSVSQGKAPTLPAAKVSAAMESLECWHSENVRPQLRATSADALVSTLGYDPDRLPRPAGSIFHSAARIDWVRATTLLTGRASWLPYLSVLTTVAVADRLAPPLFTMDTNGLASGNTYDEAALHGLYELMERDSQARTPEEGTQIDPRSIVDAGCRALLDQITRSGNDVTLHDRTVWPGYPCVDAGLRSTALGGLFGGCGLHDDPAVAISRALTEAAQSRLTVISGAREDIENSAYSRFGQPAKVRSGGSPLATLTGSGTGSSIGVRQRLVAAAAAVTEVAGFEPLAVVLEFPGACVPVVRVVAPGLQGTAHDVRTPMAELMSA